MDISKERLLAWVVPILLLGVLVILALLQYRWSSEISQAATARIHADLEVSMMKFREDLAHQLGTLCVELLSEPDTSVSGANRVAEKIQLWESTSSTPGLTKNVYFWTAAESGTGTLLQLNIPQSSFETIAWAARLKGLQQELLSFPASQPLSSGSNPATSRGQNPPNVQAPRHMIGGIDQSIPILAVPTSTTSARTKWLLVELDSHALENQFLPQLIARYFGDSQTSEYEVAITSTQGTNTQLVYASNPEFLNTGNIDGDASLNLFGPPMPHASAPQQPFDFFRISGVLTPGVRAPLPGD